MKLEYRVVHSRRRTVAICLLPDGSVEVRCPWRTSLEYIDQFVQSKQAWIDKKSASLKSQSIERSDFKIEIGDTIRYLGKRYPIVGSTIPGVSFDGQMVRMPFLTEKDKVKKGIILLYKQLAKAYIPEQVAFYANKFHLHPNAIGIHSASTRWGSCSGKNHLNFSWKLMMSDPECVQYVIIHELAHTIEHNHSSRFWDLVAKMMPDYKEAVRRLRLLEKELQKEDWK